MGIARWRGHDSRGLDIPLDDIPDIIDKYNEYIENGAIHDDHIGFIKSHAGIVHTIYSPKYENPELTENINGLVNTHEIVQVGDLIRRGVILVSTGDEIGKLAYGTGSIPFVRTSDIANWEIKLDPKQGVSEKIYAKRFTQDIIDTLGRRIHDLQLPIPKGAQKRTAIIKSVETTLEHKAKARALAREAALSVAGDGGRTDSDFLTLISHPVQSNT